MRSSLRSHTTHTHSFPPSRQNLMQPSRFFFCFFSFVTVGKKKHLPRNQSPREDLVYGWKAYPRDGCLPRAPPPNYGLPTPKRRYRRPETTKRTSRLHYSVSPWTLLTRDGRVTPHRNRTEIFLLTLGCFILLFLSFFFFSMTSWLHPGGAKRLSRKQNKK